MISENDDILSVVRQWPGIDSSVLQILELHTILIIVSFDTFEFFPYIYNILIVTLYDYTSVEIESNSVLVF